MTKKLLHFNQKILDESEGAKIVKVMTGGGVGSSFVLEYGNGEKSVVKSSTSDGINNGRRKLLREAEQIRYLRRKYPELQKLLPEILRTWKGKRWAAVEYPYYKGETFTQSLQFADSQGLMLHKKILSDLVNFLIELYISSYRKATNNSFGLKNLARASFRVRYLNWKNDNIRKVINSKRLKINGKEYTNPSEILKKIRDDERLLRKLSPSYLGDCVHGDINLTNVLIKDGKAYKLLDFRGSRQKWDLIYDLAKMLFTSGYELIRSDKITSSIGPNGNLLLKYVGKDVEILRKWEYLLFPFESFIENSQLYNEFEKYNPSWRSRLRMNFAIHYLADSACRLVAGSEDTQPLASYLLGTVYLNRFASDIKATSMSNSFYSMEDIVA